MAGSASLPYTRPTDGFGGSLYFNIILLPVYSALNSSENNNQNLHSSPNLVSRKTTFYLIDELVNRNQSLAALGGLTLGLTTLTLLNAIILTPQMKRRLPIFYWATFGLTLQTVSSIFSLWLDTAGPNASSYLQLTHDYASIQFSHRYIIISLLYQIFAILASICVQWCLFTQARSLLSSLRIQVVYSIYVGLLAILAFFGLVAIVLQIIVAIWETRDFTLAPTPLDAILTLNDARLVHLQSAKSIAHAVSVGCWCVVIGSSSINECWKRRKLLFNTSRGFRESHSGPKQNRYDAVLSLLSLLAFESFIIPIMLCFLQFCQSGKNFPNLEECIEPAVLCLLPLRSLFLNGTADQSQHPNPSNSSHPLASTSTSRAAQTVRTNDPARNYNRPHTSPSMGLSSANGTGGDTGSSNAIDRELHEIDTMA